MTAVTLVLGRNNRPQPPGQRVGTIVHPLYERQCRLDPESARTSSRLNVISEDWQPLRRQSLPTISVVFYRRREDMSSVEKTITSRLLLEKSVDQSGKKTVRVNN